MFDGKIEFLKKKDIAALHLMVPTSAVVMQAHQLDPTKHYLRLKFLIENQVQFYIPKPEEDVCDLVRSCSQSRKCNVTTLDIPLASFDIAKKEPRAEFGFMKSLMEQK